MPGPRVLDNQQDATLAAVCIRFLKSTAVALYRLDRIRNEIE